MTKSKAITAWAVVKDGEICLGRIYSELALDMADRSRQYLESDGSDVPIIKVLITPVEE